MSDLNYLARDVVPVQADVLKKAAEGERQVRDAAKAVVTEFRNPSGAASALNNAVNNLERALARAPA